MDDICETPEGKNKLKQYCKTKGRDAGPQSLAYVAGATACVALVTSDTIYVANAGDSRSVLCLKSNKGPEATELSIDHKPSLPTEQLRIEQAGMFVEEDRVNGILNLSRSLGDLEYKKNTGKPKELQAVTCVPEIKTHEFNDKADFLIIACDGIWDCLTSQEAVNIFYSKLEEREEQIKKNGGNRKEASGISEIIGQVFDQIIAKDIATSQGIGCDNMTCLVIKFKH